MENREAFHRLNSAASDQLENSGVRRGDVLSAWSGLRPLVKDPDAKDTQSLVRNHLINISKSGLLTIAGGKWTTYRAMAEETVDAAVKEFSLKPDRACITAKVQLVGSQGWNKMMFIKLIQQFGLESDVAKHLSETYGDRAWGVCSMAPQTGLRFPVHGRRIDPVYPYIDAEVTWACRREYAATAVDRARHASTLNFVESRANSSSFDLDTSFGSSQRDSPRDTTHRRPDAYTPSPTSRNKDKNDGKSPSPRQRDAYAKDGGAKKSVRDRAEADGVFHWSDDALTKRFMFSKEVGFGNWGSLWLAFVEPDRQTPAALKLVHRTKDTTSAARVRALWNEYKCMRALRSTAHPNLIAFHAFILTPSYSIVCMDYHPSLIQVSIPESRAKVYARQLLSAVEHLHVHGITHNDIKPANILLASDDRPVMIDFGFAQQWNTRSPDRFLSSLSWGTIEYLSPERSRGDLHDERLSDIWALGITIYELVVGRTPFEQSEEETFLNRGELEIYYQRTLTGRFYGDYLISSDLESLVRVMVEVDPHLRLQSCGKALQHRFFDPLESRNDKISTNPTSETPTRMAQYKIRSMSKTPTSSAKKAHRSTPKKKGEKGFLVFQDDDNTTSPSQSVTRPSPRSGALANVTNQSPSGEVASLPFRKISSSLAKKSPAPSRIPVRKVQGPKPATRSPSKVKRNHFVADDTFPVPPLPNNVSGSIKTVALEVSQSALQAEMSPTDPPPREDTASSVSAIGHQPQPVVAEHDESFDLVNGSLSFELVGYSPSAISVSSQKVRQIEQDDNGTLSSNRTSPILFDGPKLSERSRVSAFAESSTCNELTIAVERIASSMSKASRFLKRSFSRKLPNLSTSAGELRGGRDEIAFPRSSSPSHRKMSTTINERIRKLSIPLSHVTRPSAGTLAGLKESVSAITKRRKSSSESNYSFIEAEPLHAPRESLETARLSKPPPTDSITDSIVTPVRVPTPACVDAEVQRARLVAFSAHVQQILETRRSFETPRQSRNAGKGRLEHESDVKAKSPTGTALAEGALTSSKQQEKASKSPSSNSAPRKLKAIGSGMPQTPSPPLVQEFKPGHRRIPTAIRNVPSVVLHESADEEVFVAQQEDSAVGKSSEGLRIASPPPPPRVVEPSRKLPTWIAEDSDNDEEENLADVDEPTITIGMVPRSGRPSNIVPLGTKTAKEASLKERQNPATLALKAATPEEQRVALQNDASEVLLDRASPTISNESDAPFKNLHFRTNSRTSTLRSSNFSHSRSRSVLSFFTRAESRASTTTSVDWAGSVKVPIDDDTRKSKKTGKLRRVVSKIFR
ncbi:hypothetical protein JCM16303_000953 [Sporobolomyces ruberrimus]